jgi:LysR family transcriptional regulator, hydrogen peroxide-inducible genes activator
LTRQRCSTLLSEESGRTGPEIDVQIERNEIRVFLMVLEAGGFSRAAERLNLSQSAVSQTIANLEHKVGTALLARGRTPRPTEAGLRMLRYAQAVSIEESAALQDIQQIRRGALSTLNLAMNSLVNRVFGRDLLLAFCERNPLTRLKLDVAPSREIVHGVDEDRWELGFGPFQHQMPGHFETHRYFAEQRMLVVHRGHPRLQDLVQKPRETLKEITLITSYLEDAARRPGYERLRDAFGSIWEVTNLELRLHLAAAGMGVLYVSDRLVADLDGFLPIDGLEFSMIERQVGLYYKKHQPLSEGAKRFVALCQQRFTGL